MTTTPEAALIAAAHTYRKARATYLAARDIEEKAHVAYSKASTGTDLRKRYLETWPALAEYFERMKAEGKSVVWTASQAAKPPRELTLEECQCSHDFAAKQCEGRTLRESPFKVPVFMDFTLPPPAPCLRESMGIAAEAQAAGIEWQGRRLVDVQADIAQIHLRRDVSLLAGQGPPSPEITTAIFERLKPAEVSASTRLLAAVLTPTTEGNR